MSDTSLRIFGKIIPEDKTFGYRGDQIKLIEDTVNKIIYGGEKIAKVEITTEEGDYEVGLHEYYNRWNNVYEILPVAFALQCENSDVLRMEVGSEDESEKDVYEATKDGVVKLNTNHIYTSTNDELMIELMSRGAISLRAFNDSVNDYRYAESIAHQVEKQEKENKLDLYEAVKEISCFGLIPDEERARLIVLANDKKYLGDKLGCELELGDLVEEFKKNNDVDDFISGVDMFVAEYAIQKLHIEHKNDAIYIILENFQKGKDDEAIASMTGNMFFQGEIRKYLEDIRNEDFRDDIIVDAETIENAEKQAFKYFLEDNVANGHYRDVADNIVSKEGDSTDKIIDMITNLNILEKDKEVLTKMAFEIVTENKMAEDLKVLENWADRDIVEPEKKKKKKKKNKSKKLGK